MKITREQLRNIVGEVLQEEKDYQSFFKAMLKKHGVSSPDEFKSDEEKKSFFNKVEDTWKGVSERLQTLKEDELTAKQQKIDLNKNGKVDGDDLSKLRAGTKTEGELSAAQQKIDLNKNGKVDGSDLSKLRAGAKTEGEMETSTSLTKILSKEGETLVKSGAGKMYNITKVNEAYPGFTDKKVDAKLIADKMRKDKSTKGFADKVEKMGKVSQKDLDNILPDYITGGTIEQFFKESVNESSEPLKLKGIKINKKSDVTFVLEVSFLIGDEVVMSYLTTGTSQDAQKLKSKVEKAFNAGKIVSPSGIGYYAYNESVIKEGKYDADLDKIEAAVKGATSFMNVGTELKKAGIKYDFTTSMIPMYMIKVSGNTIAIVNKKYAADAEKTVGDIAIGLLN
jgi:hypothetical protein